MEHLQAVTRQELVVAALLFVPIVIAGGVPLFLLRRPNRLSHESDRWLVNASQRLRRSPTTLAVTVIAATAAVLYHTVRVFQSSTWPARAQNLAGAIVILEAVALFLRIRRWKGSTATDA